MGIIETVKMLEREEGSLSKSYKVVHNLLLAEKFSIKEVAQFADVTEEFVMQVKKEKGL